MKATSTSGIRGRFAFISLLALLAGGAIYLFLRPGEFVFHNWLSTAGLEGLFFPNVSASTPSAGAYTSLDSLFTAQWTVGICKHSLEKRSGTGNRSRELFLYRYSVECLWNGIGRVYNK